eukprot:3542988-Amphidinium_carterae.1
MVVDTMPELPVSGGEPIVDNEVDIARTCEAYRPTHRLTGKQTPPSKAGESNRCTIERHRYHKGDYIGEQRGQRRKTTNGVNHE